MECMECMERMERGNFPRPKTQALTPCAPSSQRAPTWPPQCQGGRHLGVSHVSHLTCENSPNSKNLSFKLSSDSQDSPVDTDIETWCGWQRMVLDFAYRCPLEQKEPLDPLVKVLCSSGRVGITTNTMIQRTPRALPMPQMLLHLTVSDNFWGIQTATDQQHCFLFLFNYTWFTVSTCCRNSCKLLHTCG